MDGDKDKNDKDDMFDFEAENDHLRRIDDEDDNEVIEIDDPDDEENLEADKAETDDGDGEEEEEPKAKEKGALSPKLQKRFDRLTAARESEREAREAAERRAEEAEARAAESTGRMAFTERAGAQTALAATKSNVESLRERVVKAIEDGDTATQVKLQSELYKAETDERQIEIWLQRNPEPKPGERTEPPPRRQQEQPQPKTGRARFAEPARPWYDRNKDWYDDPDRSIERAAVVVLDQLLTAEGYEVSDPDRYEELDRRLRKRFPDLKKERTQRRQEGRQRLAGVDRDSEGETPRNGGKSGELSDADKRLMRRFKLDPGNDEHVKHFHRERRAG